MCVGRVQLERGFGLQVKSRLQGASVDPSGLVALEGITL